MPLACVRAISNQPVVRVPLPRASSRLLLRDHLRAATRAAHDALDRALMPAGLVWTRDRYVRFLRATLAVLEAAERALVGAGVLSDTDRTARLRGDLGTMGAASTVAPIVSTPGPTSLASDFGSAYVIEGSQLGGVQIASAVAADLGLDSGSLTYLRPLGVSLGARWHAFVARLDAFGETASAEEWREAEAGAQATFAAFEAAFRREGLL
jgi:heme oxygenase